jgi:hypothetical protein
MMRKGPVTWVGVAGFEPAASSSRTRADMQIRRTASRLTCSFIFQYPSAPPTAIRALDACLTHGGRHG